MKWPTKIFFLLVTVTVVSLVAMVSRQSLRSPREVLEEVRTALQTEGYDERALLRRLGGSLNKAEQLDPSLPAVRDLCAELRITRGKLLLSIGATNDARDDFLAVIENYRPGDREVRRLLVETESAAGNLQDALAQLERLLEDEPDFGPAWVEAGRLEQELAEHVLADCDSKLRYVLIEEDAVLASSILRKLAARDPGDTRRATTVVALRSLFPISADESLGQVLGLSDVASEHLARSREALVKSFEISLDPGALTRYLQILIDAGREEEALAIGSWVVKQGPEHAEPQSAELLIRLLLNRGDHQHAAQIANTWVNGEQALSAAFLRLACEAMYLGNKWPTLLAASFQLRSIGSLDDEAVHSFYFGVVLAQGANKRADPSILALTSFARSAVPDPTPGARARAWREVANMERELGDIVGEREALQAALNEKPADAGPLWLRRAEIQLTEVNNGYRAPLDSWAQAMCLMPERTQELLETFIELGEKTLLSEERSLDVLYEDLVRSGLATPRRDYGPYVRWRLAQRHGNAKNYVMQAAAAKQLLDSLPNFVPALDQLIEARKMLGDRKQYIELVLQRIELTGLTDSARALLATIEVQEYNSEQLIRVMQQDPRATGRMVVAAWFANNGDNDSALATLASSNTTQRSDPEHLFGARVLVAEGDYLSALQWLERIPENSLLRDQALRLAARAAMLTGNPMHIQQHVTALLDGAKPAAPEMLGLVDGFVQNGNDLAADIVYQRIPAQDLSDPGAALQREVQIALLKQDWQGAARLVERAGAFWPESSYLACRILLAAKRGDWNAAQSDIADLRATPFGEDPFVIALLDLLSDQTEAALESANFVLSLAPDLPEWVLIANLARGLSGQVIDLPSTFGPSASAETELFLYGATSATGDETRTIDPREVAAQLLLAKDVPFTPLALGLWSKSLPRETGTLWPDLLSADLLMERGRASEATERFRKLLTAHTQCMPAWDALEALQIQKYHTSLHPELANLREARLRALAAGDPEGPAGLLLSAQKMTDEGDHSSALRMTLNARTLAPEWYEAGHALAELYTQLGDWDLALAAWRELVAEASPANAQRAVGGFLAALRSAAQAEPPAMELSAIKLDLDRLSASFPSDPAVVLAQARLDLRLDTRNPALALERAWLRLRSLRADNAKLSLEELGRGATEAWASFYVETDPDSAADFLLAELARQPGNLHLWQVLGRVHRELGQFTESLEILFRVSAMAPSAEVLMEIARTFVAQGAPPFQVGRALQQADTLRRTGERNLENQLLMAEAHLNDFQADSWSSALTQLELLWEDRHQIDRIEMRTRLAQLYGRALLLQGEARESDKALEVLKEMYPHSTPPYQREHFACLQGMALSNAALAEQSPEQ